MNKMYELKLKDIIDESHDVKTYVFEKPKCQWTEGTNVHVAFPDFEPYGKELVRHLSLTTLSDENDLRFTTRLSSSQFKSRLASLKVNDPLIFFKFNARIPLVENRPLILLSMGVGLAAYQTLFKTLYKLQDTSRIKSISIAKEVLFSQEMNRMNIAHTSVRTRKDYWTTIKETYNPNAVYYIIGSETFIEDNIAFLKDKGHCLDDIKMDKKQDKTDKLLQ